MFTKLTTKTASAHLPECDKFVHWGCKLVEALTHEEDLGSGIDAIKAFLNCDPADTDGVLQLTVTIGRNGLGGHVALRIDDEVGVVALIKRA